MILDHRNNKHLREELWKCSEIEMVVTASTRKNASSKTCEASQPHLFETAAPTGSQSGIIPSEESAIYPLPHTQAYRRPWLARVAVIERFSSTNCRPTGYASHSMGLTCGDHILVLYQEDNGSRMAAWGRHTPAKWLENVECKSGMPDIFWDLKIPSWKHF